MEKLVFVPTNEKQIHVIMSVQNNFTKHPRRITVEMTFAACSSRS